VPEREREKVQEKEHRYEIRPEEIDRGKVQCWKGVVPFSEQ
jgi:hypothetical protein